MNKKIKRAAFIKKNFAITSYQFNTSLLNKSFNLFKKERIQITDPHFRGEGGSQAFTEFSGKNSFQT